METKPEEEPVTPIPRVKYEVTAELKEHHYLGPFQEGKTRKSSLYSSRKEAESDSVNLLEMYNDYINPNTITINKKSPKN